MSLNCVEIEKIIGTFPESGMIKKVFQPDKYSIIINIYNGKNDYYILGSVQDKYNRICFCPEPDLKKTKQMRFEEILNSGILGGRIKKIFQYKYSRIVVMDIEINNSVKKLLFRLWGNAGNILLLNNDDSIIESLRRYPDRQEWPDEIFIFPDENTDIIKYHVRQDFQTEYINEAVYNYYNDLINDQVFNKKKNEMKIKLKKEITDIENTLKKIYDSLSKEKEEIYWKYGELLKANIYKFKKGDKKVILEDFETQLIIEIPIEVNLTPVDNINKYFNKYKKIKTGRIKWDQERIKNETKLQNLKKIYLNYDNIDNILDLFKAEINLKDILRIKEKKTFKKDNKISFRQFILDQNFIAIVSRNAKEADKILNYVSGNDYWFHIRDYAGSHVIVKRIKGKELTGKAKLQASTLAVFFSKGRNDLDADIYFSFIKYLKKEKKGTSGLVFPTQESNINLKFDKNILDEILSKEI